MKSKKLFIVVQEGGSSTERYVHAHNTLKEANKDCRSCAKASYRTTRPIEVLPNLAELLLSNREAEQEFYEMLDRILRAPLN